MKSQVENKLITSVKNQTNLASVEILNCIQIVMINTTLPANIGSAARAMHTMGLRHLVVVDPKLPIDETSISHAAGAQKILAETRVVRSVSEALKDSNLVLAASSRSRSIPRPVVNPLQASRIITDFLQNQNLSLEATGRISILFGREDRGLTNEELALASYHIQIDANPDYPVLNVASAVQVIASFIYAHISNIDAQTVGYDESKSDSYYNQAEKKHLLNHVIRQEWDEAAISHAEYEKLNAKVTQLMISLDLADADSLRLLPQRLSRLTSRMQLDKKEYQLISSVLAKLMKN